jgi:hypothetical protein
VKILAVHTLIGVGSYAKSRRWRQTREEIHRAVRSCEWPPGSGSFTIYPESGKKRGEGNGVKPIRDRFVADLKSLYTGQSVEVYPLIHRRQYSFFVRH